MAEAKNSLLPTHLSDLHRIGLSDDQIRDCGFRSESDPDVWSRILNWNSPFPNGGAALCLPYYDEDGQEIDFIRVKPDNPRKNRDGQPFEVESPKGKENRLYLPPATRSKLADPTIPLWITVGEVNAAKADQEGLACLGLVSLFGWQKPRPKDEEGKRQGPHELIADFEKIEMKDRVVYFVISPDPMLESLHRAAETHLTKALGERGATVRMIALPAGPDGKPSGLAEFLHANSRDDLQNLADSIERDAQRAALPTILIDTFEYRVNAEAAQALAVEQDLFQRGGQLVAVTKQRVASPPDAQIRRHVGSPVIRAVSTSLLRERLTRCANWVKVKMVEGSPLEMPAHPPGWAIQAVHDHGEWPGIRQLEAVVTHPVFLADGSILNANGYDSGSGLLIQTPSSLEVNVPEQPTQDDFAAAIEVIEDVICDFPFKSPEHRSAWYAGLLTPLAWFAFNGPAPMFLADGNVRGIGKGMIMDVIGLTVTGRRFPTMAYTNDREELRKKITTLAVEGERLVLLDNLTGSIGNDTLDLALTSTTWKDRLLGGNKVYDGPLHLTWYATGNNVQLEGDTSRRICHVRMETEDEHPELKSDFRHPKLRQYVRCQRGRLLSAALTILRAWHVAGRPKDGLPSWGSFDEWSDVVRACLVYAGLPDPALTRENLLTTADRDAENMAVILAGMRQLDPQGMGKTTAKVVTAIHSNTVGTEGLKDAILELCGEVCPRALAGRFRHYRRRNFGGFILDNEGQDRTKTTLWVVRDTRQRNQATGTAPASPASPADDYSYAGDDGDAGAIPF
jgi:hypothetical protein